MAHPDLKITLVEEVDSTNSLALKAIKDGAPQGVVFAADRQIAGRGRRHADGSRRPWFSPPGKNLYLSVVIRPQVAVHKSSAITIAVGATLVDTLRQHTGVDVELKWPNDLYVGNTKLGGILTEAVTSPAGLQGAAVGIGINVNVTGEDFPDEICDIATSLVEHRGRLVDRMGLLFEVAGAVIDASETFAEQGLEAFSTILERHDWLYGKQVHIEDGSRCGFGEAIGIGAGGGLRVRFDDGTISEIVSGEVSVVDDKSTSREE